MPPVPVAEASLVRRRYVAPQRAVKVIIALVFASAVCAGMVAARRVYVGRWSHMYIIWNLMLAWIPVVFAYATYNVHFSRTRRNVLFAACALTWFFFFPNAPYIITDFVHLDADHPPALMWIDLFTIAGAAWTGLCLGYLSLCLMQEVVYARLGRIAGWLFVLGMLVLSSLGIYMGRFLRWNSWDVLRHPLGLFQHGGREGMEFVQPAMKVFLVMTFLFLLLSYGTLYTLAHLHEENTD